MDDLRCHRWCRRLAGVGEMDVTVPFKALKITNCARYLVMNTTKEALPNAPSYVFDKTEGAGYILS